MVCKKCTNYYLFVSHTHLTHTLHFDVDDTFIKPIKLNILGEKKLAAVVCPDPWRDGSKNTVDRKLNENKLLSKRKRQATPYRRMCRLCHGNLHKPGKYCQSCAYKKGICSMCGKKVLDTKMYKQSST